MTTEIAHTIERLEQLLGEMGSVLVAYSGGVDSAVILTVACRKLGRGALGVIADSPSLPRSELSEALALAEEKQLAVRVIQTNEHLDPRYAVNDGTRCFHCRSHLFERLTRLAEEEGFKYVVDGVHADDRADHVGGMRAAAEFGVRSPLLELDLGKTDIRAMAGFLNLPVHDKPSAACLASRIPTGTPVTAALLKKIAAAEEALRQLGFTNFRVRHHGYLARIEIPKNQTDAILNHRETIVIAMKRVGYDHITLDLTPRKSSSSPATGVISLPVKPQRISQINQTQDQND